MCRKKVFFSPFLSSSSSEKRDESGKHEAEKLPDKFETFHDGYTTFLIRLYRLSSRQRDGGEDEMLSLAVFFFLSLSCNLISVHSQISYMMDGMRMFVIIQQKLNKNIVVVRCSNVPSRVVVSSSIFALFFSPHLCELMTEK